jgi:S1-C subfamily serine protease
LGRGGPKLRFHIDVTDGKPCKPVRQMLRDARDVGGTSGGLAFTTTFARDLLTHATLTLKIGFPVVVAILAFGAAYLGGWIGGQSRTQRLLDQQLGEIRKLLEGARQAAAKVNNEEIERLRAEMQARTKLVDEWAARDAALQRILREYSRGVCLLHGIFTFTVEHNGVPEPIRGADGEVLSLEYVGSGFLVSAEGQVITNRHVAEPWWRNATASRFLEMGLQPRFLRLEAVFPERPPQPVDPASIRLAADEVDVAVLRVTVTAGVPVLPLSEAAVDRYRGGRVVLLGYPTGINALLARAEPDLVERVLAAAKDTTTLIAELAKTGAITPVITQGALNEVQERRLVYDAETTSGGSGGPVFAADGTVIGVNFAVTVDFDGSNFGVPIGFARALLP